MTFYFPLATTSITYILETDKGFFVAVWWGADQSMTVFVDGEPQHTLYMEQTQPSLLAADVEADVRAQTQGWVHLNYGPFRTLTENTFQTPTAPVHVRK
jgi:hypothetical protein